VLWACNKGAEQGGHSIYSGHLWVLRILDGDELTAAKG
jgi:hypothetical protein